MTAQDLMNSVLQLAIQGKLVEQRAEEGTARELIAQIGSERERLIKAGDIKKEKPLPEVTEDEIPFEIPKNWEWVRLGKIGSLTRGSGIKRSETIDKGFSCVRYGELYTTYKIWFKDTISFISEELYSKCQKVQKGDVLMTLTGENKTDIAMAVAYLGEDDIAMGGDMTCWSNHLMEPLYLVYLLNSSYCISCKRKMATGDIIVHISNDKLATILLPIPPLAEQKRIVKKIEELLPYIEKYNKIYSKLETYNKKFPEDIQKAILQYAMQGKLVEQRPEEGTGEELYWQIQTEKEKLIKEGKIKKEKSLPGISEDEKPFDIPSTWVWVKVGDIFTVIRGSSPRPKGSPLYWSDKKTDYSWITIKDISVFCKDGVLSQTTEYLTEAGADLSTYVGEDELIIAVSGSTTGKHCILGIGGYIYDGLAAILNPTKIVSSSYLLLFFDWVYDRLNAQKVGSAFPNINTDILKNTLMPLPPLGEQERIIAAMKNIMSYCKRLRKD